ncbi:extracellular solute-binding protein [Cryobacterium sp. TMT1-62]|uniref:ABC transporter substrate-binding protein n=1 Tax=unclassified Cryobacterium TaxID=2649013 RepID=UPI000CE395A3|nr:MULTISPECIES: extracellular solute-binding protein [unclassified Cryobacterium]TFB55115.1 extracellular solute-binding protein [Cryobacterium sp. Sr3]TFC36320.1 extracellular solute-binding protein [Cryobacterium sp. TMT2-14]TFC52437.1 extracellular solute-binding protein [Cryobacterium sp. TMT2-17-1]TFD29890.1 extracellular solute-binding protein [Cryobacterium sp. TMT1-62]
MKVKFMAAIGVIAVAAAALTGCSADGAASKSKPEASCTNKIVNKEAPQVTVWAWYPAFEEVVDVFNTSHDDVQVCWTNAGQGNDEYTKFSTSIESKSGAPDVIMLESEVLSSFTIRDALVDLTEYGANDVKDKYTEGSWKDASSGDAVYAIPVDGGPMGMLYRQDLFDQYGIPVPTTWAEFATAAQALKTAGSDGVLVNFPTNGRAFNQALFAQAGSVPFTYDSTSPIDIGIAVDDQGSKDVLNYWNDLVQKGLVTTDDAFTADYNTSLVDGTYAVYLAAAWGPGYLQGLSDADTGAVWRVAPLPQWDTANPVQVNWGGSTFAVTSQATDKELAAQVAIEIFGTDEAWKIGVEKGALFPSYTPMLDSEYFVNLEYPFFGGQQINKEVFLTAAAGYGGATFSPFQNYAYDQLTEELYSMVQGEQDGSQALDDLQATLVKYAAEQGFTVAK